MNDLNGIPIDIIYIIKEYIPYNVLFYTSKKYFEKYYIKYRLLDMGKISKKSIDNILSIDKDYYISRNYLIYLKQINITSNRYLNMLLRNDYDYILNNIIKIKYNNWKKIKNYYHKGLKYPNYIIFLESQCIKYNSNKCRSLINDINKNDTKFRKKRYKKIKTISNKWMA